MTVRVLATNTTGVVRLRRKKAEKPGGLWMQGAAGHSRPMLDTRDRVGRSAGSALFGLDTSYQQGRVNRVLTTEQLWLVYQRSPDVRAAIDAIVRRVATWGNMIKPELDPAEAGYESALDAAQQAERFLQAPNEDGETWQEVMTKWITDLLVFDAGVIENVFDTSMETDEETGRITTGVGDKLEELVALRGGDIRPLVDTHGRVMGYQQDLLGTGAIVPQVLSPEQLGQIAQHDGTPTINPLFSPRQIVYLRMFANTSGVEGVPLIETILNEITTMLRQAEHTMLTFDADEIPPGILVLTGLAGMAAEAAKADLQKMRGKDHKIRVVTSADPTATGAKWVELRRSNKDVDFINVVKDVRRTIWRVFGVMPVEMGASEDIPRAVGQVQLEVGSSHLINPILELIEGKINARILPLVLDAQGNSGAPVRFRFDRDEKLTPAERKEVADTLVALVQEGLLTRNEARKEIGQPPLGGGDIATVDTPQGPVPLQLLVSAERIIANVLGQDPDPDDDDDTPPSGGGGGGGGGGGSVDDPGAGTENPEDDEAPGEVRAEIQQRALIDDFPSEWQPRGMFANVRTLQLSELWEQTAQYARRVEPLYDQATRDVLTAVSSRYTTNFDSDDALGLTQAIGRALDKLETDWALSTSGVYRDVGRIGRDAAANFTGLPVLEDIDARSAAYGDRAMRFLCDPGGLIADLRASLAAVVGAVTDDGQTRSALNARAVKPAPVGLTAGASAEEVLLSIGAVMESQKHRISNWSGKLVELSNQSFTEGLLDGSAEAGTGPDGQPAAVEWMVEWVNVGDNRMCPTCSIEGARGFVPVSQLSTMPGGATECGGRCRCVLVMWTRDEVNAGRAVPLSGGNRPPV